jgi:ketosteroid isomerase-like protein
MNSRQRWSRTLILGVIGLSSGPLATTGFGQEENPVHDELRALRDDAVAAFEARDIDRLLTHVHPNVVVTWQNAEVSRGHDGVRKFYQRMMEGEGSEVESLTASLEVDELSILYGDDTAIAFGSMAETFKLRNGLAFELDNRWSATLVHEEGKWLIAAFHVSTNMFDNGLQDLLLKANSLRSGGVGLAVGLLAGIVGALLVGRRRGNKQTGGPVAPNA